MKWTISINQKAAVDAKINVDMVDLAIFDMLKDYSHAAACRRMQDEGKNYFSVPYKKVLDELPLLPIKTSDGVYRRFKKLELAGLIELHPNNAKLAMVWFAWARNYDKMVQHTPGYKSEGTDTNPRVPSDENPTPPRMKIRPPSDENPTHPIPVPITNNPIPLDNTVADAIAPPLTGPFEKVGEVEIPSKPEPRVSGIAASRGGRRGAAEKDTHDPWTKTIASLFDRVGAECGIAEPFNWQVNAGRDFKALKEIRKGLTSDIAKKKAGAEPTETEIETGFEYLFRYGYKYLSDIASQKGGAVQYNPATIKNCYNQIISYAKAKRPTGTSKAEQNRHDMAEYLAGRRRAAFTRLYGEEVGTAAEV